jgi:hypothetical protein
MTTVLKLIRLLIGNQCKSAGSSRAEILKWDGKIVFVRAFFTLFVVFADSQQ